MAPSLRLLTFCFVFARAARCMVLEAPNTCTVNACERAVRSNYYAGTTRPAPDECHRYLATIVTPQPVTQTITTTTVVTNSAAATVSSEVTGSTTTEVVSETATAATATYYTTPASTIVIKRTHHPPCPAPASPTPNTIPSYASACTNDAMFSSACACVGITTGRTRTLHPCTSYVHTTVTQTTSQISTTTILSTVTATAQTTTTISVFPTTTVNGKPTSTVYTFEPICDSINEGFGGQYGLYYSGAGYSESPNNPGNGESGFGFPPHTNTLSGGLTPCAAAQKCASLAYNDGSFPFNYLQFELLYLHSTADWQCTQYFDPNPSGGSEYDVANPDVLMAYGFNAS